MIELALLPQHLQVVPGGLGRCSLTLHTDDAEPTEYTLTIHGLDAGWYTFSVTRLMMVASADGPATLTLHPPPSVPEGIYPFEVIAIRLDDPDQAARLDALLVVDAEGAATPPPPVESPAVQAATLVRRVRREPERSSLPWWILVAAALLVLALLGGALAFAMHHSGLQASSPLCGTPGASRTACTTPTPRGGGGTPIATPTALSVNPVSGVVPPSGTETGGARHSGTVFSGMPDSPRHPGHPGLPMSTQIPGSLPAPTRTAQVVPSAIAPTPTIRQVQSSSPTRTPPAVPTSRSTARRQATVSATHLPTATRTPTATNSPTPFPTATPPPTWTPSPTATTRPTRTPTATHTATPRPSPTGTHTDTPTPPPTATPVPTITPVPTLTPTTAPTATVVPIPTATRTSVPTPSPISTASPAAVALQYGFTVAANYFSLRWEAVNAAGVTVDNHTMPVNGQQLYPLRTHTFVLTAIGADGSQTAQVVAVVVVNNCLVLVNGQREVVPTQGCLNPATQTPTVVPTYTPYPTSTVTPTDTMTPTPVSTATGGVPGTAGAQASGTPGVAGAQPSQPVSGTPALAVTVFPTDTMTPTP